MGLLDRVRTVNKVGGGGGGVCVFVSFLAIWRGWAFFYPSRLLFSLLLEHFLPEIPGISGLDFVFALEMRDFDHFSFLGGPGGSSYGFYSIRGICSMVSASCT